LTIHGDNLLTLGDITHTKQHRALKPYLYPNCDLAPFKQIDSEILRLFRILSKSMKQVSVILENRLSEDQLRLDLSYFSPDKSWRLINNIDRNKKNIFYGIEQTEKWRKIIYELNHLIKDFVGYRQRINIQVKQVLIFVENIQNLLRDLLNEGNKGLSELEMSLNSLFQKAAELNDNLENIPDGNILDKIVIMEYRHVISTIYLSSIQIKDECNQIQLYLNNIARTQKWCDAHLKLLQNGSDNIQKLLVQLSKNGLNVKTFEAQATELAENIKEAKQKYANRTPEAYEILSGNIQKPGQEEAVITRLIRKQDVFYKQLLGISNAFQQAKEFLSRFKRAIQEESDQLRKYENNQFRLNLSDSQIRRAITSLKEAESLIQIPDMDKLTEASNILQKDYEFIENSKILRQNFDEQLKFLTELDELFRLRFKAAIVRAIRIIKELSNFSHDFLQTKQREPKEWKRLIASASKQLLANCKIDPKCIIQSDVQNRYYQGIEANKQLENRLNELQSLEVTLDEYRKLYLRIEKQNQQINSLWDQVSKLSQSNPLPEWQNEFYKISATINKWNTLWPSKIGGSYERLYSQAEEISQSLLKLIEMFDQHLTKWRGQIKSTFDKLEKCWEWLDERTNGYPKPSISLYELKYESQNYHQEYVNSKLQPIGLKDFFNRLNIHLNKLTDIKDKIQNDDEEFNIAYEQALNHEEKAINMWNNIYTKIHTQITPAGWPIINEINMKNLQNIHNELQEQQTLLNSLINSQPPQPYDLLMKRLRDIIESLKKIVSQIDQEEIKLVNRYNNIIALSTTIYSLLELLYESIQKSEYRGEPNMKQIEQYNKIMKLIGDAKNSKIFEECKHLLETALDKAKAEIPEEISNPIIERYISISTGSIYNEQSNLGMQAGNDLFFDIQ